MVLRDSAPLQEYHVTQGQQSLQEYQATQGEHTFARVPCDSETAHICKDIL